ncbi:MAG TPA: xanthine dehydrogenase family protein molybdopterin-binding subunit, partial [Dehalococcoidia bacterium]|nr:xanthine dehydrogenase family protein molybdopterin-binding subunit [Dehalococcoidia bacterium]
MPNPSPVIGVPIPRIEGADKVSGRALYAADVALPGTLWAKILRSPYPSARIVHVDVSAAWEVPGVRAVISGKDVEGHRWGRRFRDMPVLCWDRVRFVGDRVAAVAADTLDAAEEALQRIEVEYEELPAVFDPLEAMQPGAPLVHDDISQYEEIQKDVMIPEVPNGISRMVWQKGNLEKGFQEADLVVEHTFRIPSRHHGYLEPHTGLVAIDESGRVQVWTASKSPFGSRSQLAKAVGLPDEQVLVHPVHVGGDFGGKGDALDLPIAYFLAKQSGRPVRIVMTYLEELLASNPSHETVVLIRTGLKRDGRMVARYLQAVHNSGAYGAMKPLPHVGIGGAVHGGGPYRIDNTLFEAIQVYTNTVPAGFFRAPGAPQINFAVESHTDLIAKELGMDPARFRLQNIMEEGDENAVGERLRGVKARETLEAALQKAGWDKPKPGPNYGRGIAMYERHVGAGPSSAAISLREDGSFAVISPTVDQGGGIHTVLQQIVAEEMQVPLERVQVVVGDTDTMPPDMGVGG